MEPPATLALNRRGVLVASGVGVGAVLTTVGQTLTPLQPIGLLAIRQSKRGPQRVPVNRTAEQAGVMTLAAAKDWRLEVAGPRPYRLSLAEIEELASTRRTYRSAAWRAGASALNGVACV